MTSARIGGGGAAASLGSSSACWVFCLLAALSIGIFFVPVALLLALAASLTPDAGPPPAA